MENLRQKSLKWWNGLTTEKQFEMLKKHGFQNPKKPWLYNRKGDDDFDFMYKKENILNNQ